MRFRRTFAACIAVLTLAAGPAYAAEGAGDKLRQEVREGVSSVGEYANDALITTKVKAKLVADETVKALDIKVQTTDRVVHLTGQVDTPEQRETAERLAKDVADVKAVVNDLQMKG